MTDPNLRALIELHEGRVPYAYLDSLGFWTIGVGHLIDQRKGGRLPDEIIESLLDYDLQSHTVPLYKALPWIVALDPVRRAVLIDMAFNLGVQGLLGFKHTLELIKAGDFAGAAAAMLQSVWAGQVKTRARRLAQMMRTGEWPADLHTSGGSTP